LPILIAPVGGWVGSDDFTVTNLTTGSSITVSNNNSNSGWLVGAGIECGLGDRTFTVSAGSPFLPGDTFTQSNRNVQMVKAGINYRFNWGSPGAARSHAAASEHRGSSLIGLGKSGRLRVDQPTTTG
jgi:hypothetical protein